MANGAHGCANVSNECVNDVNVCANESISTDGGWCNGRVREVPGSIPGAAPSA